MFFKFLPQEFSFFEMFNEQAGHAVEAANVFKETVARSAVDAAAVDRMRAIEHRGDEAAHAIIDRLNRSFITPFDREDIFTLTKELDDVTDMLNTTVRRLYIYRLAGGDRNLIQFSNLIHESVTQLARSINGLKSTKESKAVLQACVEVHRLENVGDSLRDAVLAELFEKEKEAAALIKWKEIYEAAETVLDVCEDVANIVESILVKQA